MNQWIDDCLNGLIDMYETNNVYDLYGFLEIAIVKLSHDNILLQGNEAIYSRNYLDKECVFIRENLDLHYEKFILAHELGHALLHTDIHTAAFNSRLINTNKIEMQANYFAIRLLISESDIDYVFFDGMNFEQISSYLGVPKEFIKYRFM